MAMLGASPFFGQVSQFRMNKHVMNISSRFGAAPHIRPASCNAHTAAQLPQRAHLWQHPPSYRSALGGRALPAGSTAQEYSEHIALLKCAGSV